MEKQMNVLSILGAFKVLFCRNVEPIQELLSFS